MTIVEMLQRRATLTQSIRALMNEFEGKEMPADKQGELAKLEADFDKLNKTLIAEQAQQDRERIVGEGLSKGLEGPKSEQRELFAKALSGDPGHMQRYQNALSLGTDATAGYLTAPVEFVQDLIMGLANLMFMRRISNVVGPIGAAQSLGFPYIDADAADATWVAEVTAAPEETTLSFGRREFKPNKMAKLLKVSRTLIQHAPMADRVVLDRLLQKIQAGGENAYMNGNGTAQPLGIFVGSASGIPTSRDVSTNNTTTTVSLDGLQDAKYSLKQQYWANANWVCHRDLAKMVAKIKDGEGNYMWQPAVIAGQPDRLLGFPVNMSEYAPNTFTTGLYVAVLGDFKAGYWICDADGVAIQVLRELYAATNQIGYLVDYFGDGAPVCGEAFARVKLA
jgi:HK97 family phage major capsid protein